MCTSNLLIIIASLLAAVVLLIAVLVSVVRGKTVVWFNEYGENAICKDEDAYSYWFDICAMISVVLVFLSISMVGIFCNNDDCRNNILPLFRPAFLLFSLFCSLGTIGQAVIAILRGYIKTNGSDYFEARLIYKNERPFFFWAMVSALCCLAVFMLYVGVRFYNIPLQ